LESWKGITQDHVIDAWKRLTCYTKVTGNNIDFFRDAQPLLFSGFKRKLACEVSSSAMPGHLGFDTP
jgi:hypothetical protein